MQLKKLHKEAKLGLNKVVEKLPIRPKYNHQYVHYFQTGSSQIFIYNLNEGSV